EMFQHRSWRKRVESGDVDIVAALIEEALATWRKGRPPRGTPANLWAGVQEAQLIAVEQHGATVSSSAEAEFRTEGGQRVQVASALDSGIALASKLLDMILYDVPNLRLGYVRVDIYSTFAGADGTPEQRLIITVTADRSTADSLDWEALTPEEVLGRFGATYERAAAGQPVPIELPPLEGQPPRPTEEAAAEFAARQERGKE
ncbi:MAG: hypothetical protein IH609_12360, partial [Dehalococcoidia bacterium]|nr:hypothetical protein [Dehalococcoidia bacterium]